MTEVSAVFANVTKSFRGTEAIRGLTLSVPKGSVFGLLGRNGAGKSTALRCLVGLERLDDGEIRVLDRDPLKLDVSMRQRIGYLSEEGVPFPAATAEHMIRLCAPLYPTWNRSTLVERVLGFGLLQLVWFLSFAAFGITNERRKLSGERWTSLVLFLVAGALMAPTILPWLRLPWGPPPIWLAGLLAATGAYLLRKRLAVPAG